MSADRVSQVGPSSAARRAFLLGTVGAGVAALAGESPGYQAVAAPRPPVIPDTGGGLFKRWRRGHHFVVVGKPDAGFRPAGLLDIPPCLSDVSLVVTGVPLVGGIATVEHFNRQQRLDGGRLWACLVWKAQEGVPPIACAHLPGPKPVPGSRLILRVIGGGHLQR